MSKRTTIGLALAACVLAASCGGKDQSSQPVAAPENGTDMTTVAQQAYEYGFPMVMNLKTIYEYVINTDSKDYKGPFNEVACVARVFTPQDTTVVTPNSDTPYCMFWMDLRREPYVLSVPHVEAGRYYGVQLIDLYTHNFAYVGTRTNDNVGGDYLLSGPGWHGEVPDGLAGHLESETDFVFLIIRTQLHGPDDIDNVVAIQHQYAVEPLSTYAGTAPPPPVEPVSFPKWVDGAEFTPTAYDYLDFALRLVPPYPDEVALRKSFASLGIGGPEPFSSAGADAETAAALAAGVKQGVGAMRELIAEHSSDPLMSAKIFGTRQFLEQSAASMGVADFYLLRAAAALAGLYGNSGAEAIYPTYFKDSDGDPLDASKHDYVIAFTGGNFPPAKAFWSLSMYDGKTQLFIDNPLDRYLLNSAMEGGFDRDDDGTVRLLIQHDAPADDMVSNWLPAPDGPFYVVMRLYLPAAEALEGKWTPPPVTKQP